MLCSEFTILRQYEKSLKAEPLYCRSWSCEICAPRRARQLRGMAMRGRPDSFLTLTVNPAWGASPQERARRLVVAWRNIRQAWSRQHAGKKLPFLAVFEETKRGEPHLHIIMRAPFISQRWLSKMMRKYMDAPIVDIRRVKNQKGAAMYVSKYLSKGAKAWEGCKRYWRSKDWLLPRDDDGYKPGTFIAILRRSYDQVMHDYRTSGITWCEVVRGNMIKIGWWSDDYVFR